MATSNTISAGIRSPKAGELVAAELRRRIVHGELGDGDFLPTETELMGHFNVSRPTLREAVRVLESEGLVEVRRGSRTGARVCIPGPEIVARPAALLLELSGAKLADVMNTRMAIEPIAARMLAESSTGKARNELRRLIDSLPGPDDDTALARAAAHLHRRIFELSGSPTLAVVAGMLHEITERHIRASIRSNSNRAALQVAYPKLVKSFNRLHDLVVAGNASGAEQHWRKHMESTGVSLVAGLESVRVRDILD
jgi:GntR family transcriptional regulator, transcriptional repressor for pyruvate dehydrogenase complex